MNQRWARHRLAIPLALSGLLICAQLASAPALTDPVAGHAPPSLQLHTPWVYFVLAPLFTLWDGVSMLSMSRLIGFLVGLAILYMLWRLVRAGRMRYGWRSSRPTVLIVVDELKALGLSIVLFAGFVVIGAIWHRPMLSLAGTDPQDIVVDFHSHTNASHDVEGTWMRGFDAAANQRWHTRAGFDAAFITDHNQSPVESRQSSKASTVLCPGIELSVWRAHIVLLGSSGSIDRSQYNKSPDGLLALLAVSDSAYDGLSLASLPEYRRNHWDRIGQLAAAGLDGFELVNASPKANELTRPETDRVIAVARAHNRFVAGVSDSHGWGATSMVWNLVRPTGTRSGDVCSALLGQLRTGFLAVRVIERHRVRPDSWWPMWLTPAGVVWETWRSMGWALAGAWLVWIWAWALRPWRRTAP